MTSLITRLEAATGPDRELDLDIHVAIWGDNNLRALGIDTAPNYTASLDTARSLVPEGWSWFTGEFSKRVNHPAQAQLLNGSADPKEHRAYAATPAIALTIAALKARGVE